MIWKPLGFESDNTPGELERDEIDLYLNRSFWEVMDKFPFREKELTVRFDTIAGERHYNIPQPNEAVRGIYIVDHENQHHNLDQITDNIYYELYDSDMEEWAFPEKYVLENCFVRLWPTPDDIYELVLKRYIILADISDTNSVPDMPQVWHEIIGFGGLWRAYIDRDDSARAYNIKQQQISLINSLTPQPIKELEANTQYAAVKAIRPSYP